MAKYNLLVLSMVLLACSTIPARISGQSKDVDMIKSEDITETRAAVASGGAGAVLRSFNGCYQNRAKYIDGNQFCCNKDNQCWETLQECIPNCPCNANCSPPVPRVN